MNPSNSIHCRSVSTEIFSPLLHSVIIAAVSVLLFGSTAKGELLTKEQLAQKGAAATALVDVSSGQASAFCVHPSGLFITSEHVVRKVGTGPIKLILNTRSKTQKVFTARVLRSDKELGLAVLRVEGHVDLQSLDMGSIRELTALAEVVAMGYPSGQDLALEKGEYPSIGFNAGRVKSLHRKDGELQRIQLDTALDRCNSGGPVLDQEGKVVGVVQGGVPGPTLNYAIPVSHVKRLVAKPDVQFKLPLVKLENQHLPVEFQVKATTILPSENPLELELILRIDDQQRTHKMVLTDGVYRVSAIPVPPHSGKPRVNLIVIYSNGQVIGNVADQHIKIGEKAVKLSGIRSLQFEPKVQATLRDGKSVMGTLSGLDDVVVKVGGEQLSLNLKGATQIQIDRPEAVPVRCSIAVRQEGEEVAHLQPPQTLRVVENSKPRLSASGVFVVSMAAAITRSVYATDVDDDGDVDVLSASLGGDKLAWYENDGSEGFTVHPIDKTADPAVSVHAVDVDSDGDVDVLSASIDADKITWYENDGSQRFTAHTISDAANGAANVFTADVDGDGDIDVLSASLYDNKIAWYENDGSQNFTAHPISTTARGAQNVFATDMDGDGDIDVLSASRDDNKIAWYENDGSEAFIAHSISTAAAGAHRVFARDMDGDGDIDVLSASMRDNKIAWYENDGRQHFTSHAISTDAIGARSVFAEDLDGDGDIDVLSASLDDNKIAWYENDGGQRFTAHTISATAAGAHSVFSADVDGDGDIDVVSASMRDNKIAWYENLSTR